MASEAEKSDTPAYERAILDVVSRFDARLANGDQKKYRRRAFAERFFDVRTSSTGPSHLPPRAPRLSMGRVV